MPKGPRLVAILKTLIVEEESSLTVKWRFNLPPFRSWGAHALFRHRNDVRRPGERIVHIWKQHNLIHYSAITAAGDVYFSTLTENDVDGLFKHFIIEQDEAAWPWLANNLKMRSMLPANVRQSLTELHNLLETDERDHSPVRQKKPQFTGK